MEIAILITFILLGAFFIVLEIFLLPGFGIGGIAGIAFIIAAIWYAFTYIGITAGWITCGASALTIIIGIWLFIKTRMLDRIALDAQIDGIANPTTHNLNIGDTGKSLTRLAPIGNARFDSTDIEVKSEDGFIDPNTEIIITEISANNITVRKYN